MRAPNASPYGGGWSAQLRDTQTWEPAADGERRSFSIPSAWGPGARAGGARITNTTRGTLYVLRGAGSRPDSGNYEEAVPPYQTITVSLGDAGLSAYWSGTAGTAGGEVQRVTVELVDVAGVVPSAAGMAEPPFPYSEEATWRTMGSGGGDLNGFGGGGLTFEEGGATLGGQTIVAVMIENRSRSILAIRKGSPSGAVLGYIDPMSATTLLVGDPVVSVEIAGPAMPFTATDELVKFVAFDSVPRLDPAAAYPIPGVHEPPDVGTEIHCADAVGWAVGAQLVYPIPEGTTLVIRGASLALQTQGAPVGLLDSVALVVTQGINGEGGPPPNLLRAFAIGGGTNIGPHHFDGPLMVRSLGAPYTPNTLSLTTTALSAVSWIATYALQGWQLADIIDIPPGP